MPEISVVIPVYNGASTIKEAIDSVLNQSFRDFELIVIDDGSIDTTREIISQIADSRVNIFSYPNAGLAASRNRGIRRSSGKYISFLDADDLWTPDKLEAQYAALNRDTRAVLAYSWTDYIDSKGRFLYPGTHISAAGNVYVDLLVQNFLQGGSNMLVRKESLIASGGFDESLPRAEDWECSLKLARIGTFVVVPRVQILSRFSFGSLSGNAAGQRKCCFQVIERNFSSAPASLRHLKSRSKANIDNYLFCRKVEFFLQKHKTLRALEYFWHLFNRHTILRRRVKRFAAPLFRMRHCFNRTL